MRRWPGLQDTVNAVIASYDRLAATKPIAWRLAYPAVIEATFTPYFKVFLDHEDKLFRPGDDRVASLFLWHFVEEIEHRSSALIVYNAVHDSYLYRAKTIPGVIRHMSEILAIISGGFRRHVPADHGGEFGRLLPDGLSLRALRGAQSAARELTTPGQSTYAGVPRREMLAMFAGLVRSQTPNHNPAHESIPAFAARWLNRYAEEPATAARWYTGGSPER